MGVGDLRCPMSEPCPSRTETLPPFLSQKKIHRLQYVSLRAYPFMDVKCECKNGRARKDPNRIVIRRREEANYFGVVAGSQGKGKIQQKKHNCMHLLVWQPSAETPCLISPHHPDTSTPPGNFCNDPLESHPHPRLPPPAHT